MKSIQDLIKFNLQHQAEKQRAAQRFARASTKHSISGMPSEAYASKLGVSDDLRRDLCVHFDVADDSQWLATFQAASYCMDRSGRTDINWHNVLLENRRDQNDMTSVLEDKAPRGNVARLGELGFYSYKGKTYYRVSDLDYWLAQLPKSMRIH